MAKKKIGNGNLSFTIKAEDCSYNNMTPEELHTYLSE